MPVGVDVKEQCIFIEYEDGEKREVVGSERGCVDGR